MVLTYNRLNRTFSVYLDTKPCDISYAEGATCEVDTVLPRQGQFCIGSTRKRDGASRRAPTRRATQFSSSQQPYLFRRQGYFSSKNVRESLIKTQKLGLCTNKPNSVHLYSEDTFSIAPSALPSAPTILCRKSLL